MAVRWALRVAHAFRDACWVAGAALALLLVVEFAYRGYERLSPDRSGDPAFTAGHPYAKEAWFHAWSAARLEHVCCANTELDPYRGWWVRPGRHEGLVVEPSGYRQTEQAVAGDRVSRRRVFLFGGSAMWGFAARDAATIPSFVSAQLVAAGISDVEVQNKAQGAFNLTQGLASLQLELRRGERPFAVIFLDGVNEVGVVAQGERPGGVYGEARARERYRIGGGSTKELLGELGARLHVVAALRSAFARREAPAVDLPAACDTIAEYYSNQVRIGEALAREFRFKVYFLWQPTLATARKTPGPWEARLLAERGTVGATMVQLMRDCTPKVEARLAPRRGKTFSSLHGLYDGVAGDVFIDHYGHVTEQANGVIAAAVTERLLPLLK